MLIYFSYYPDSSDKRADITVNISGLKPDQAALKIKEALKNLG
jgi:hypothetical protein